MTVTTVPDPARSVMRQVETRRSPAAGEVRFRLGMLMPSVNTVAEGDVHTMLPAGTALHVTRLKLTGSTREDFLGMLEDVERSASLLADTRPDLIVFHCTAVSTLDPEMGENLRRRIEGATGVPATATSDALLAAFAALGARRIVLVSPYIPAVNASETAFLAHEGIEVLREKGAGIADGAKMAAISPESWLADVTGCRHPDADAYFVSCTNIRVAPVIEALERALDRPVVTSNQAMIWHCLRRGGVTDPIPGFGRLLQI